MNPSSWTTPRICSHSDIPEVWVFFWIHLSNTAELSCFSQGEPGFPGYGGLPGVIGYPGNEGQQGPPGETVTNQSDFDLEQMKFLL